MHYSVKYDNLSAACFQKLIVVYRTGEFLHVYCNEFSLEIHKYYSLEACNTRYMQNLVKSPHQLMEFFCGILDL